MDIQTARRQAAHMVGFGNAQSVPSLRKAIWASILSANNALDRNALQVAMLAPYVRNADLPYDAQKLRKIVAKCGWQPPTQHCQEIIDADALLESHPDIEKRFSTMPTTLREWVQWRKDLVHTFKGISWKTASFTALLMWPFDSPFGIVDRHILKRYGAQKLGSKISHKGKPAYLRYRSIERLESLEMRAINADLLAQGAEPCNLGIAHWAMWDEQRAEASPDHDLMSAYAY